MARVDLGRRHTLKKLVPETGTSRLAAYQNLARVSSQSGTTFFWYKFLERVSPALAFC